MPLLFTAQEITQRDRGLTFDDVLLVPCHSEISSRRHPELGSRLTRRHSVATPIIAANMDTVTEVDMALAMAKLGGIGILHRFMPLEEQVRMVKAVKAAGALTAVSIGVKEDGMKRAGALVDAGADILTLDIAHGDSVMMLETLDYVKKAFPHVDIIAGNVATAQAVKTLVEHGADAVKVGIGPGSMCTTRIITGCGVPQLSAIAMCVAEGQRLNVPIIADGGIKTSGDIVKAFAAGAETVMLGSMLSGCTETPGEVHGGKKKYRGMASKDAQVSWRGELPAGMAAEGESRWISCKGSVVQIIDELCGGVRSGMTYLNAQTLADIHRNARFIEMSASGMTESRPHGMQGN
jgi:IMP dehydrogenase